MKLTHAGLLSQSLEAEGLRHVLRHPIGNPRPYRESASLIEASGLDCTILRPAWLSNRDEIDYATTPTGEPFKNPSEQVSRKSVADLVVKLAMTPRLEIWSSLGIHKTF
jgi:uncharacterized protein YbjT (DUF2867 family)